MSATPGTASGGPPAPSSQPSAPSFKPRTFDSLRHRDFRLLWIGTLLMNTGQAIQQTTIGWLMYDVNGSAVMLGALNGMRSLPYLLTTPIAGVVVDRVDRKKILFSTQVVLLVTAAIMGLLVTSGTVRPWHLLVFALLTALVWTFVPLVRQTLVPTLVPRADLMNAVALHSTGLNLTKIIGPSLAGLLVVWFGAGGNFYIQAAAYALVLGFLFTLRAPPTPTAARESSVFANLAEGWGYVRTHSVVLGLLTIQLVPNIFATPVYISLMPVFQKDILGVGPEGLGLLMAAPGAGALATTLLLASFAHRIRRNGLVLLLGLALLGVSLVLFSRMVSLPLALAVLFGVGSFQTLCGTTSKTVLQMTIPDAHLGRVMSIYLLDQGLAPIGAMTAGFGAEFFGAPDTVAATGAMVLVLALVMAWRVPAIRQLTNEFSTRPRDV